VQRQWPARILTFRPDGSVVVVSGPAPWEEVGCDDFATATVALIGYPWPRDIPGRWWPVGDHCADDADWRIANDDPSVADANDDLDGM
jgi:hypothetical protein